MTKVGFISLGCSKNLVDTEVMLKNLYDAGFEITPDETEAEIVVVNTCGFIESAKQESIDNILDIAWLKEHGKCKHIVATGCLVERYREEVMNELPEVDALVGVGSLCDIAEACAAVMRGEKYTSFRDKNTSPLGVKEINLIAQDTTRYGLDIYGKYSLADLVKAITENTAIPWIRLLYCYPDKITDELIEELKNNTRLVKYMDIPIQHIADPVLERMNRHGGTALIKETVKKLRDRVPGIVLRTTAMVGFPGEREQDFVELCEFVKEARFDRFGAFTFSPEEGTAAAEMPDQIDEQIKQDRYDTLMQTQLTVSEELSAEKIGQTLTVLCDGYDTVAEIHYGRSYADAPDVDGRVYFKSPKRIAPGTFCEVKITEALDYDVIGEII